MTEKEGKDPIGCYLTSEPLKLSGCDGCSEEGCFYPECLGSGNITTLIYKGDILTPEKKKALEELFLKLLRHLGREKYHTTLWKKQLKEILTEGD